MENPDQQSHQSAKTDLNNIGKEIGINKYRYLQSISEADRTEEQKDQIEIYLSRQRSSAESLEATAKYFDKIMQPKPLVIYSFTARELWDRFRLEWLYKYQKEFVKNELTLQNMAPLLYYFSKDQRFFDCKNLSNISEPSFDKGLLVVGSFGNGKTATMKIFESIFTGKPPFSFKGYSANEGVLMFEKCIGDNADVLRKEFEQVMYRGNRYFDDLKTERMASNYGKVNIFKEILEERYNRREPNRELHPDAPTNKTHVTCNYKDGFDGDPAAAVEEFGEIYGNRVYDRMFEMFNVIEFNGKSFRR